MSCFHSHASLISRGSRGLLVHIHIKECPYDLSHLTSSHLTSCRLNWARWDWSQHDILGRALRSDPVCRGCEQSQRTQFRWNKDEVASAEWCRHLFSSVSLHHNWSLKRFCFLSSLKNNRGVKRSRTVTTHD